jgi:hypothetical protein
MQANDITPDRLRRLATTRPEVKVLSVFLNLDPREFATPPARDTEVSSVLDRASRLVRQDDSLSHAERQSLEQDLERVRGALGNGSLDAKGAHGVAIFSASAAGLFEVLKLAQPVDHEPVVAATPCVEPLAALGPPERWCVLLANRRAARLLCGSRESLEEVVTISDRVHGQHEQGGWSQSRYQRSVDKDAADHLRHAAEVTFEHLHEALPDGLLVGGPQELVGDLEAQLHPYLRERLAGRLDLDVEASTAEQVREAAAEHIEAAARRREDEALARLAEAFGTGERAASGLQGVLVAVHEQRVERLLIDHGFRAAGVACPTCGWLGAGQATACPADGSALEHREDVVEAAVARALTQSAEVLVLRDRPELASHGHVAAILRF